MIASLLIFPLLGALLAAYGAYARASTLAGWASTLCMAITAIIAWTLFLSPSSYDSSTVLFPWMSIGGHAYHWSLMSDVLTRIMGVVVTTVSAMVHLYSLGYMDRDSSFPRFMGYLSLFTFFMLLLISSPHLVQLFVGWEGVGLCSYLLIGFWFHKDSANMAAMKAFLVNRIADVAFIVGMALVWLHFGTFDIPDLFTHFSSASVATLNLIAGCLFIGCMGKSAQFLLHVWLPDAMEGPTPVSALIHAATMVTAGVFVVARLSPLYEMTPLIRDAITLVGAITALFAASIALTQPDIKRIIAYSTCSQLGYMFMACGLSGYHVAIFHLFTHAFFKALLFLAAGSVIHAVHHEQNIFRMGGLARKLPVTYAMMWIGSLALAGVIPFAGYYSKDAIIELAWLHSSPVGMLALFSALGSAFLTAFYSWRLLFVTFHGPCHVPATEQSHIHESPWTMRLPLIVLAVFSLVVGWAAVRYYGIIDDGMEFWRGSIHRGPDAIGLADSHHLSALVRFSPLLLSLAGIALAWLFYVQAPSLPRRMASLFRPLYRASLHQCYMNEFYHALIVRPLEAIASYCARYADKAILDRFIPHGATSLASMGARFMSAIQTSIIYHYAWAIVLMASLMITLLLWGGMA